MSHRNLPLNAKGFPDVDSMSEREAKAVLTVLQGILWGDKHWRADPNKEWRSDTLCQVAEHMTTYGLKPPEACLVTILGVDFTLRPAAPVDGCNWILKTEHHVIMAWEVSSTAGGRAWNFRNPEHEDGALARMGCRLPTPVPSSRGELLIVVRPLDEVGEEADDD